jgi:DNA repair protein RadC
MGALPRIAKAKPSPAGQCRYQVDVCDPALLAYLRATFAKASHEELRVIYCDHARHYLFDEVCSSGNVNLLVARFRPMFERALALGAGSLLLAHNHLSGDCRPSAADIRSTRILRDIGTALEVELIDHLIFAERHYFSMACGGCL